MKAVFGGVIAFVLLGLYASSVVMAIAIVMRKAPAPDLVFTEGFRLAMTTIGALVSALVISVLAATDVGEAPLDRSLRDASRTTRNAVFYAMIAYLGCWVVCGLASFVVGVMVYPNVLSILTDHGKAWIGLAVATGYAYFGLRPASSAPRNGE